MARIGFGVRMGERCDCDLCQLSKRIDRAIKKKDFDEMVALITELANWLASAEFDRDYYKSIVDGSWPQAEEILTKSLAKAKEINEKESENGT